MKTKVKWLMPGKRQTDRFGAWEWVEEGQISEWPADQLRRVKEGLHYELVAGEAPAPPVDPREPVAEAQGEEKVEESASQGADEQAALKRKGRRKIKRDDD